MKSIIGLLVLTIAMLILVFGVGVDYHASFKSCTKAQQLLTSCETALPENKHCVLIAKPQESIR